MLVLGVGDVFDASLELPKSKQTKRRQILANHGSQRTGRIVTTILKLALLTNGIFVPSCPYLMWDRKLL